MRAEGWRVEGRVLVGGDRAALTCALATPRLGAESVAPRIKATIQQYCVTCHNQRLKTGGLALDTLDIANVQLERGDLGTGRAQAARRRDAAARRAAARSDDHRQPDCVARRRARSHEHALARAGRF